MKIRFYRCPLNYKPDLDYMYVIWLSGYDIYLSCNKDEVIAVGKRPYFNLNLTEEIYQITPDYVNLIRKYFLAPRSKNYFSKNGFDYFINKIIDIVDSELIFGI